MTTRKTMIVTGLAVGMLVLAGANSAQAQFCYYPAPVVVAPAPVYMAPPVVYSAPVYSAPVYAAPVYYARPYCGPVYRPYPVYRGGHGFSFGFSYHH